MTTFNEWVDRMQIAGEGYNAEEVWDAAWNLQQAKIDRLMLEYCPDEMTKEQLLKWAKHQRVVKGVES